MSLSRKLFMQIARTCTVFLMVGLIAGCSQTETSFKSDIASDDTQPISSGSLSVTKLKSPAGLFAGEPNFAISATGEVALSWVETTSDKSSEKVSALYLSLAQAGDWSAPKAVASGKDWFVNWADFPAVAIDKSGVMLASWLEKSASATYSYDVHLALSHNYGDSWQESFILHSDGTSTEHGFVSLEPLPNGGFAVAWLDGRETVDTSAAMTLRFATVAADGTLKNETRLDQRTCDCCQTSMTVLFDGSVIVAYRDRSSEELRDAFYVRGEVSETGEYTWSAPAAVASDNWKIEGCPVNGPALASSDSLVVMGWFTMGADEKPKVYCAFSRDFGQTFEKPLRLDGGVPLGRVDVVMLDSQTALVSWLEEINESTEIIVRTAKANGDLSKPVTVTESSSSRASGFARMAPVNNGALIAWTHTADTSQVQTALITLNK